MSKGSGFEVKLEKERKRKKTKENEKLDKVNVIEIVKRHWLAQKIATSRVQSVVSGRQQCRPISDYYGSNIACL
jgi:hypothetical protein